MKRLFGLIATVALATGLTGCFTQVDTGNVGVESTMGQVKSEILAPGVHFTAFKTVTEVSGKEFPLSMSDMRPQTADKITLSDLDVDIYVQTDTSKAPQFRTRWPSDMTTIKGEEGVYLGMNYVARQAREAIYGELVKYNSATVHTERSAIAAGVAKALQKDLDAAGQGWFFVRSVNVRNLVTDPALEKAIKEAANAQFETKAKEQQIEVAKKEADRKRIEAQGEADAIRIKSQAISAQGGAEYVQLQAIERWDGKLPVTSAGGAVPFINLK